MKIWRQANSSLMKMEHWWQWRLVSPYHSILFLTLLLPNVAKGKIPQKIPNSILWNFEKQLAPCVSMGREVSFEWSLHRVSSTDSNLELPYKTPLFTLAVKGLNSTVVNIWCYWNISLWIKRPHIAPRLNFIRLLRVVITPSVVVGRRKRLKVVRWILGYHCALFLGKSCKTLTANGSNESDLYP